jgi:hypothetical protein
MLPFRCRLVPLLVATAGALAAPLEAQEILHFLQGDGYQFGASVSGLGDVDGDLVDDLIVNQSLGSSPVLVLSGADGSIIHSSAIIEGASRVSRAGDVNADGIEDYMASEEYWRPTGGTQVGMVAIGSGADGTLLRTLTGTRADGRFGSSIAPAGDVNLDGHDDILVGSAGRPGDLNNFVRIYSGADGAILLEVFGSASVSDQFGSAVAGLGDIDLDGHPDFLVGAPFDSSVSFRRGSATVHSGLTGAVLHRLDGPGANADFGRVLCGTGDLDHDGIPDFAIAYVDDTIAAGLVTVYSGAQATVLFTLRARPDLELVHTYTFGAAMDASGDCDGDGLRDLVVGNLQGNLNGRESGEVYVFSGAGGALLARFYGSGTNWEMGSAVAVAGDLNGDGLDDVVVGAPRLDFPNIPSGAALVFAGGAPPLLLECPAIRRVNGSDVRALVSRATPFATVYIAGSPFGLGTTNLPQYQVTLALRRAQIGASAPADALGAASFTTRVPPMLYGRTVWLQAFEQARTSNWIERVVHQPWYW